MAAPRGPEVPLPNWRRQLPMVRAHAPESDTETGWEQEAPGETTPAGAKPAELATETEGAPEARLEPQAAPASISAVSAAAETTMSPKLVEKEEDAFLSAADVDDPFATVGGILGVEVVESFPTLQC